MIRRAAVSFALGIFWISMPLFVPSAGATPLAAERVDLFYQNWERALEESRSKKGAPVPVAPDKGEFVQTASSASGTTETEFASPAGAGNAGSYVIVGGKRIALPSKPEPESEPASEPPVDSATGEAPASTQAESAAAAAAPKPTPALVAIKVAKAVDGKIVEVEVWVTPTPSPASATQTAQAAQSNLPGVTGEMAVLQRQLKMAATASKKKIKFTRRQVGKLLAEFEAAKKKNKDFNKLLPRAQTLQVLANLRRVQSLATGGVIPAQTARNLLKVLFPKPKPPKPTSPAASAQVSSATETAGEAREETDSFAEGAQSDELEIYIDPETGQEVYWDGTPVYSQDGYERPPPEEYYEEEGEVYYEEEGTYEGEGEVYYEEEYYEEDYVEEENY